MKLKNKVAIITGAGSGIGKAIALEMAKNGAVIIATGHHIKPCQETVKEIEKTGGKAAAMKCDVTKEKEVREVFRKTARKFKKIDILVNNAGVLVMKPLTETSEEEWQKVMNVNLKGIFLCARAAAKHMSKKKSGVILSIASIAGQVGFPNLSAYCASKGGIVNATREFALELAPYGIRVNAIAPAVIRTDMTKDMLSDKKQKKALKSTTPLGRIGEVEEVARPAVFLCSDDASYITGHTLNIDGGWLAQ